MKFRILEALTNSKESMTTRDIEYDTGIHYTKISSAMSHYPKIVKKNGEVIKLPYIQRLAKKGLMDYIGTGSQRRGKGRT
ncbi:MAG: hypothetical protein EHM20_05875 [Alphaproteobacteria bacterium]|nr:MAG: hypothetical protein EHM20_05875 [Alphaproteobacteria bacterium]